MGGGTPNSDTMVPSGEGSPGKRASSRALRWAEGAFLGRLLPDPSGPWRRGRKGGRRLKSVWAWGCVHEAGPGPWLLCQVSATNNTQRPPVLLELEAESSWLRPPPPALCPAPSRRPSGIPEKDLCSVTVPCLLRQRDALQHRLQRQEAENRQLADTVLAGRRQVQELQLQGQARWQAWQVGVPDLPSGPVPWCGRGDSRPGENK